MALVGGWTLIMNKLKLFKKSLVLIITTGYFLNILNIKAIAQYDPKYPWETPWYIPNGSSSCSSDNVNLIGNDNLEKIYNYFISKGLPPVVAAGIAGNAMQESSLRPRAVNEFGFTGLFQWDPKNRFPSLVAWANEKGLDPYDLYTQLEFAYFESSPGGGERSYIIEEIKLEQTIESATFYWAKYFEGYIGELEARIQYAKDTYALYGSNSITSQKVNSPSACTGGNGQYTQYKDNFVIYKQYDPQWEKHPFGSSTLKEAGCGPTSMAMIVSTFLGKQVLPTEIADFGTQNNLYIPGEGSAHAIFPMVAEKYGLKSEKITADIPTITTALRNGGLVNVIGSGPEPFTENGHIIVVRAITPEGKWLVGDSGHNNTDNTPYDPQDIMNGIINGKITYAFAIYK